MSFIGLLVASYCDAIKTYSEKQADIRAIKEAKRANIIKGGALRAEQQRRKRKEGYSDDTE